MIKVGSEVIAQAFENMGAESGFAYPEHVAQEVLERALAARSAKRPKKLAKVRD